MPSRLPQNFWRRIAFVLWLGVLAASAFASAHAGLFKPFTLDETDITERAWLLNTRGIEPFLKGEHYWAHPPLYEYVVAWITRAAGSDAEWLLRGFGLAVFAGVMALIGWVLRFVLREEAAATRRAAGVVALSLCLSSPYLVQHSLLIDADTTGTVFFLTLLLWGFVRFEGWSGVRFAASRLALAVIFALLFWSKEVTPIPAAAGFLLYRVLRGQWKRMIIDAALVFGLGTVLAWGVWLVYCTQTGVEPMTFIRYTLMKKTPRVFDPRHLTQVARDIERILRWPIYWATAPFLVWAVMSSWKGVVRVWRKRAEPLDAAWVVGWTIFLPYIFAKPTIDMMKYQHPVLALWIPVMAADWARAFRPAPGCRHLWSPSGRIWWWMLAAIVILGAYYYRIGDYLLWAWDPAATPRFREFIIRYYAPLAVVLVAGIGITAARRGSVGAFVLAACLATTASIGTALHWRQTASYTTTESWMNYGEGGFRETLDYLKARLKDGDAAIMRKDFHYYLKAREGIRIQNLATRDVFLTRDPVTLVKLFGSGRVRYVVIDKIEFIGLRPEHFGTAMKAFEHFYVPTLKTKNFTVYRHRSIREA